MTFTYTAPTTLTNTGKLKYTVDDTDPATGKDQVTANNTGSINVDRNKLNKATMAYFGWVSSDKSNDHNMVVMDTNSDWLNATATSSVTDKKPADGNGSKTIKNGDIVYGGDPLDYTYTITNVKSDQTPNGVKKAYLRTKLPTGFDLGSNNVIGKVTYSDGTKSEDITKSEVSADGTLTHMLASDLASGVSATLTISGNAAIVSTDTPVSGSDWRAYNGGVNQPGTNPNYTIKPSILTTVTGTGHDLTQVGSPVLKSAQVFAGDQVAYTFTLNYKQESIFNWNAPITASFTLPTQFTPTSITAKSSGDADQTLSFDKSDSTGNTTSYTASYGTSFVAGVPKTVTFTVLGNIATKMNDDGYTATTGTATFSNDQHKDTCDPVVDGFNIRKMALSPSEGSPTIKADTNTIYVDQVGDQYEGADFVNISGMVTDEGAKNNSEITMFMGVINPGDTDKDQMSAKHIQLTDETSGRYSLALDKPTIAVAPDYDANGANPTKGQAMEVSGDKNMLTLGKNTVTVEAVDSDGNISNDENYTVYVGVFKFMQATESLQFPTTKLTGGDDFDVKASNPMQLTINNSQGQDNWQVTAQQVGATTSAKKQPVTLMYKGSPLASSVLVASSQDSPKADSDGNITVIDNKTDLSFQINSGAAQQDYSTKVDWTLINSIQ